MYLNFPLKVEEFDSRFCNVVASDGEVIATTNKPACELIVNALNNHLKLLSALRNLLEEVDNLSGVEFTTAIPYFQSEQMWETALGEARSILSKVESAYKANDENYNPAA